MQSPRTRYQLSKQDVEWHKRLVQSIEFERAIDAAMLSVVNRAQNIEAIIGAREFLAEFAQLSNVPMPPTPSPDNKNVL